MRTSRRNIKTSKEIKQKYESAVLSSVNAMSQILSEEEKVAMEEKNKTYEEMIQYAMTLNHKERRKFLLSNKKLIPKVLLPKINKETNEKTSGFNAPKLEMAVEDKLKFWKRRK